MLLPLYVSVAVAILFYVLIPLAGAIVRSLRWARFRKRLIGLSSAPALEYADIAAARRDIGEVNGFGPRLFLGAMDALEGEDLLWLRSGAVTAIVDFSGSPYYALEPEDPGLQPGAIGRAGGLARLSWRKLRSFSGGTKVMVAGMLRLRDGRPVFVADGSGPLVAVSYDGDEAGLTGRIVAAARSRNEFQNGFTFLSWAVGMAVLGFVFVLSHGSFFLPSVLVLSALVSLAPILAFLPPGMGFVFVANRYWKKRLAILMRRDLASIPPSAPEAGKNEGAERDGPAADTPRAGWPRADDGREDEGARAALYTGLSGLFLGLSVATNGVLAFLAFRLIGS